MQKILLFLLGIAHLCPIFAQNAKASYQIDMIIFMHENAMTSPGELPLLPNKAAISLKKNSGTGSPPYTLLPAKFSHLQKEYYALRRKPEYRVLMHYSWLQPAGKEQRIQLPENLQDQWKVEGSMAIKQSNYYLLNSKLVFSAVNNASQFVFEKNERLNANTIYYLDHPQAGMIIKIHKMG